MCFYPKFSPRKGSLWQSVLFYRYLDSLLSISLQWLLFTLAPNSYKEIGVPLLERLVLFSLSEEKEVEKDVAISISLYTHHEPSIPWCRLSAGRKKKFHAYLIKEAKAIIKTTAQLVIFDWLSSGCNE